MAIAQRKDVSAADRKQAVKEYGSVTFADPKNKKYPVDSREHVMAAWRYINMPRNAGKYKTGDKKEVMAAIKRAAARMGMTLSD